MLRPKFLFFLTFVFIGQLVWPQNMNMAKAEHALVSSTSFLDLPLQGMDIRLDQPGHSLEKIRVTDQKGIPLCFAFAATQIIDAFRLKFRRFNADQTRAFSPSSALATAVWTSWDTNLSYLETFNYGGFLCEAVESLLKYGSCPEARTRDLFQSIKGHQEENQELKAALGPTYNGNVFRVGLVEQKFNSATRIMDRFLVDSQRGRGVQGQGDGRLSLISQLLDLGIKEEFIPSFITAVSTKNEVDRMMILKSLVDKRCDGDKQDLSHLQVKCVEFPRKGPESNYGEDMIKVLDEELDKGKGAMPLGIKYCANFLEKGPHYRGIEVREDNPRIFWKENCLIHYSLIIGRRSLPAKGGSMQREFLIRDSYGKNCGGHSLHSHWKCEDGNIWVPEKVLKRNLLGVDYVILND